MLLCLHHEGGAQIAYDDASVVFLDRKALGLRGSDPIEPGPASANADLRVFPARRVP